MSVRWIRALACIALSYTTAACEIEEISHSNSSDRSTSGTSSGSSTRTPPRWIGNYVGSVDLVLLTTGETFRNQPGTTLSMSMSSSTGKISATLSVPPDFGFTVSGCTALFDGIDCEWISAAGNRFTIRVSCASSTCEVYALRETVDSNRNYLASREATGTLTKR